MSGLFVNFFECAFLKDAYSIRALNYSDYDSKEKYEQLRYSHKYLGFTRHTDKIYYWKLEEKAVDDLNGKEVALTATDNPRVFLKIFETALIHRLDNTKNYRVRHDAYSHVWRITKEDDLLKSKIEGLALRQQICVNTFYRHLDKQFFFGVVISTEIENRFTWGRKEFEHRGIDTSGLSGKGDVIYANRHALKHFLTTRGVAGEYQHRMEQLNTNEQ